MDSYFKDDWFFVYVSLKMPFVDIKIMYPLMESLAGIIEKVFVQIFDVVHWLSCST
ncbi:hypothetical protein SynBOUM118_00111 [Synechococcus sp. BOUM118]|nr:hypothetical protein SynBOUM118_00111 [Synechococcus sp. BOUM118]